MTGPVVVPLARALLRTARRYDRNPAMRVLLATPRQIGYGMIKADWVPNPSPPPTKPADIAAKVASDAISSVCAGARLYSDGQSGLTVQRALSSAIRQAFVASPSYEPAALADAAKMTAPSFGVIAARSESTLATSAVATVSSGLGSTSSAPLRVVAMQGSPRASR